MTDPKQIPHLIKLLDDESSDIRETIVKELEAFGPSLKEELQKMDLPLNTVQKGHLNAILEGHKRIWLNHIWPSWLSLLTDKGDYVADYKRLESALSILSEFLSGVDCNVKLKQLLDELAVAYQVRYKRVNPVQLANFLFREKKLKGDEDDYYSPQNSNLIHVIQSKKGIPISLSAVYMLVGLRLGLKVEGCHFPGHFLARIPVDGKKVFVDCFNGGQIIEADDLLNMQDGAFEGMSNVLKEKAGARSMVRRFLANLVRAYQIAEDEKNSELIMKLFREMDESEAENDVSDFTPDDIINHAEPAFAAGDTVLHVRYGYRGIIVEVNSECEATDGWYYGNQTQPSRNQPWYHVLVDDSDQVTYVAENSLVRDTSDKDIKHSLLSYFFTKDKEGKYIRNDNPWPETDF